MSYNKNGKIPRAEAEHYYWPILRCGPGARHPLSLIDGALGQVASIIDVRLDPGN
jgi:hypothetical protein